MTLPLDAAGLAEALRAYAEAYETYCEQDADMALAAAIRAYLASVEPAGWRTMESAPRLYLDCEFNGFAGELISMALVADDGREWYAVLPEPGVWDKWVFENVFPVLKSPKPTIEAKSREEFRQSLHSFLLQFDNPTIVADWYVDLVHFFHSFEGKDHQLTIAYPCKVELILNGPDIEPDVPHNALSDARAIRKALPAARPRKETRRND